MAHSVTRNDSPPEYRELVPNGALSIVPNDLLKRIFSVLDFRTFGVIPCVCKDWKAICENPGFNFTKQILIAMFGSEAYTQLQQYATDRQLDTDQLCSKYRSLFQFLHEGIFERAETDIPKCITSSPFAEGKEFPDCYFGKKHRYQNVNGSVSVFEKNFEKEAGEPVGYLIYGDGGHRDGCSSRGKRVSTQLLECQNFLIALSEQTQRYGRGPDVACFSKDITIWDINAIYLKGTGEVTTEPIYKLSYTNSPVDIIVKIEEAMSLTNPDHSVEEQIIDFFDEGKKVLSNIWNRFIK